MSCNVSHPFAAALLGASLMPPLAWAQAGAEAVAPVGGQTSVAASQGAPAAPRSGLWQTIEAEYRRPAEVVDTSPRRLSDAQRQELRDQIRRTSMRADAPQMAPVVGQP